MSKVTRRQFGRLLGTAAAAGTLGVPSLALGAASRVVVVGGGAGGASVARHLADKSMGKIDVTLVEPSRRYYTCFFSNLYLGGFREYESIGHSYGTLASKYGINVVHDWATRCRRLEDRTVMLGSGVHALLRSPRGSARVSTSSSTASPATRSSRPVDGCPTPTVPAPRLQLLKRPDPREHARGRDLRDGHATEPLPLSSGTLRARLDGRPSVQAAESEGEDHRHRSQAQVRQTGALHRRAGSSSIPGMVEWSSTGLVGNLKNVDP